MINQFKNFESEYGVSTPKLLRDLYSNNSITKQIPAVFKFKNVGFVLEVRELLDVQDRDNYDVENNRLNFAINSDGFKLLIDLNTENLDILQDEFGDIDFIGIRVKDLLEATCM